MFLGLLLALLENLKIPETAFLKARSDLVAINISMNSWVYLGSRAGSSYP